MTGDISVIEQNAWKALATDQLVARSFFEGLLDQEAVMTLPGGVILETPDEILNSFSETPWSWFKIEGENTIDLSENIKLFCYRVTAQRQDEEIHDALASSLYVRRKGTWKLIFHQQTPA